MAKKIISYKLNTDGTVPDFVEDGGYLAKNANDTPNMVVLGVSKDGANVSGAEAEFVDEASAVTYVENYLSDSTTIDPITNEEKVFVVADAVTDLFAKLGDNQ
jgi:hypothetical protein